jgi:hypothetical protein
VSPSKKYILIENDMALPETNKVMNTTAGLNVMHSLGIRRNVDDRNRAMSVRNAQTLDPI